MSHDRGKALRRLGPAIVACALFSSSRVAAQACCAGAGAVTPGRLANHEDALVGLQARTAPAFGSFQSDGTYAPAPSGAAEWDFEQDLFASLRVLPRGQISLLVPAIETYRRASGISDSGGGLGDVNLSGRYDFFSAGDSWVPGVAALVGVTFPTGVAEGSGDASEHPLDADVTGRGVFQGNLGLAVEQHFGPWLFGVSGFVSKRTSRTVGSIRTSLGAEWMMLAAAAYTFSNDAAVALIANYTLENKAEVNGVEAQASGRRIPLVTLSGLYPLTFDWRIQGGLFLTPPVSDLGRNSPATWGIFAAVVRSWS